MKQRHKQGTRLEARYTLIHCKISLGADFQSLSTAQIECLLKEADRVRYQKPKGANGSRARYFHDRLQRHAAMEI